MLQNDSHGQVLFLFSESRDPRRHVQGRFAGNTPVMLAEKTGHVDMEDLLEH